MGLSKPIIIQDSSVDISNLATKSDIDSIKNSVGGGVKSIQKVFMPRATTVNDENTGTLQTRWKDYTISSVDITKSYIIPNGAVGYYETTNSPCCEFINSTTVRVFTNCSSSNKYYVTGGFTVIETN